LIEDLLSSLASQIAISIINSRLYTALEKKINEINLLFDIERELNKADNLDELLRILIEKITDTLKVEAALITIMDKQSQDLKARVAKNIDKNKLLQCKLSLDEGIISEVNRTGELYVTNDAQNDPLFRTDFQKEIGIDIKHLVCAPLKIEDRVIGIMEVFNKPEKNEFFRSDDIRLINSLASQISRSIETYQLKDEKIKADRLASIGNMMSTIVHDLRTPMSNIYGFVDLMQEEEDQNVRQEYAEIIIKQIQILNNMTKDILDFAKGKTTILPVKHAVDKLLDDFTKVFKPDVEKKGFKFESACNAQAMIYIDPEKITRVFMNIMKNAVEAMDSGGKFSITANQINGEIEFLLSDTGKGIPAEIRDKLFDSFVTSGKKGGTGLGLAIVKKLIDQHKGRIEVDSEPGKGTTFKIYFKRL
jgi:signal transduction histidine kinase